MFTGAGISTESGIPDFRGKGGVWERFQPVLYEDFLRSATARKKYWRQRKELYAAQLKARPNPGHFAIAKLHTLNRLHGLITQNIDGLHQMAGNDPERICELHGTNTRTRCLSCGVLEPAQDSYDRLLAGEEMLTCPACGGIQKPDTISFGQPLDQAVLNRAIRWARECDCLLAVGSTLLVEPAASLPRLAHAEGAALAMVNLSETPLDSLAQIVIRAPAAATLAGAVALLTPV